MKHTSILSQGAWWPINKPFTQKYGIDASVLISDLISKQEIFETKGILDDEGMFYNDKDQIELNTSLTPYRQDRAREVLVECGVLKTYVKGTLPPRRYYRVDVVALNDIINKLHNDGEFKLLKEKKRVRD